MFDLIALDELVFAEVVYLLAFVALLGSLGSTTSSVTLPFITSITPLSETLGKEHTVDLEDSWTDTGTHRFLRLTKKHPPLQDTSGVHGHDPAMLADGGGSKSRIRIAPENLIEGGMRLIVVCAHDVSSVGTAPLTNTKEGVLRQVLVVITFSYRTSLEKAKS